MSNDFDPRELLRGTVPTVDEVELLPDSHPMLARRMEVFDFETDHRDPIAIRDLLTAAMLRYDGVGLASNQIGYECRAFAIKMDNRFPVVMFNPVITELAAETTVIEEGCLSFPDLFLKIARPQSCRVIYHDPEGNRQSELLTGYNARIALHETDHLNGIVMTSKVSKLKLDMAKKRSKKLRKG
ncbi:MAG: peptide deformylase [Stutzerimonas stutzeri]|nr:MAG: peptide deformylase [Stutzerimonas stutzeri]